MTRDMINLASAVLFVLLGVSTQAAAQGGFTELAQTANDLKLEINKGKLVRLSRPATEVFIANPEVADVQVKSPRLVYIFGKGEGETSFYAIDANDQPIYSASVQVQQNLELLKQALSSVMPQARVQLASLGGMILMQGSVASPEEAATAEELAMSLLPGTNVLNRLNILQPSQVNLRVRIAEISREITKQLGFNFEGFGGSNFSVGTIQGRDVANIVPDVVDPTLPVRLFERGATGFALAGALSTGTVDLNYAIDALDENGFINLLAEPNLTALSGETANFLAGGEFPIPIPNLNGIAIEFREFGVSLDFAPVVLSSNRISMRVRPEVSDLSPAGAIVLNEISVPAIVTRRAETTVELGSGQSFAIAGLLQNELRQTANQYPFLADIPILGTLFRSDDFQRSETELLIVVTPYLVRPVNDRQLALPTDNFVAATDMGRYLNGKIWQPRSRQDMTRPIDQQPGPSLKKRAGFQLR